MVDYQTQLYLQQQLRIKADLSRVVKLERRIDDVNVPDLTNYVRRPELVPYALKTDIPNTNQFVQRPELVPYALKIDLPSMANYQTTQQSDAKYATIAQQIIADQKIADAYLNLQFHDRQINDLQTRTQTFITEAEVDSNYISQDLLVNLLDKYTKTQSDAKFITAADVDSNYISQDLLVNLLDKYTKTQSDAKFITAADVDSNYISQDLLVNLLDKYTKTQSDAKYAILADQIIADQKIEDAYSNLEFHDTQISDLQAQAQNFITKAAADGYYISQDILATLLDRYNKVQSDARYAFKGEGGGEQEPPDLSDYYTKAETFAAYVPRAEAPVMDDYYTKYQVDQAVIDSTNQARQMVALHNQENQDQFQYGLNQIALVDSKFQQDRDMLLQDHQMNQVQNTRITDAETRLSNNGIQLGLHNGRINVVEQAFASFDPVAVQNRLTQLETKVAELQALQPTYYTQNQADALFALKTALPDMDRYFDKLESEDRYAKQTQLPDFSEYSTTVQNDSRYMNAAMAYTKIDSDARYARANQLPNMDNYYSRYESDTKFVAKTSMPDTSQFYTKVQTDAQFATKASVPDVTNYHTAAQSDALYMGINDTYTKVQIEGIYAKQSDLPDMDSYFDKLESDDRYAKQTQLPDFSLYSTTAQCDANYMGINNAWDKLEAEDRYAKQTSLPDISVFYTKTQSDALYPTQINADMKYALKTQIPDLTPYYKKVDTDTKFSTKVAVADITAPIQTNVVLLQNQMAVVQADAANFITQIQGDARYPLLENSYTKAQQDAIFQTIAGMSNYYTKADSSSRFGQLSTVNALNAQVGQYNSYWQGCVNVGDIGGSDQSTNSIPCNGTLVYCTKKHITGNMSQIAISWTDKNLDVMPVITVLNGDGTATEGYVNDLSAIVLRPQTLTRVSATFMVEETSARVQQCQLYVFLMPKYYTTY